MKSEIFLSQQFNNLNYLNKSNLHFPFFQGCVLERVHSENKIKIVKP